MFYSAIWSATAPEAKILSADRHKVNFTLLLQPGYWFHGEEEGC